MLLLFCVASALAAQAQDDQWAKMKPQGAAHRVQLAPDLARRMLEAYYAITDVEYLEPPEVYIPERLDARRAIREALIAADTSESKKLVSDLYLILLTRQTCREQRSSTDLNNCTEALYAWDDRARVELGLPEVSRSQ